MRSPDSKKTEMSFQRFYWSSKSMVYSCNDSFDTKLCLKIWYWNQWRFKRCFVKVFCNLIALILSYHTSNDFWPLRRAHQSRIFAPFSVSSPLLDSDDQTYNVHASSRMYRYDCTYTDQIIQFHFSNRNILFPKCPLK